MVNLGNMKYEITSLREVDSTNSYALKNINSFKDRTVIYSLRQTNGRGRYNRHWVNDDTDNLYVSFVFKPDDILTYPLANLTQYLSVIVCRLLKNEFDIESNIKWPNDILVDGHKISGILAETHMKNNQIEAIVLGLGLNVNLKEETVKEIDQKATSLNILKHKNFDVDDILNKLCNLFFNDYDEFIKKGFSFIKEEYISSSNLIDKEITLRGVNETKNYTVKTIDNEGFLTVKDKDNNEYTIMTGDVLC